jgi:hypothetical protein
MQGDGEITWPNGKRLQGHFESNRLVGECKVAWADGRVYQGRLSDDYELSGFGILQMSKKTRNAVVHQFMHSLHAYQLGEIPFRTPLKKGVVGTMHVYIGHFLNDIMQGYGVLITPIGSYEGKWQANLFHGQGTCLVNKNTRAKGMKYYSGSCAKGAMHGFGMSNSYEGFMKCGLRCGVGADKLYTGDFKDDKYDGYGVLREATGQYEGEWRNGLKEGSCTFKLQNGDEYVGSYSLNKRSGYGVMHYANGERYEGNWTKDVFHGEGTFYSREGKAYAGQYIQGRCESYGHFAFKGASHIYKGEVLDGLPHGSGRILCNSRGIVSSEYEGAWENGKMWVWC